MPRSFPTLKHLTNNAEMRGFRQPHEGEPESEYRTALADFVLNVSGDPVEAMEIRAGIGWNGFSEDQNKALLRSVSPGLASLVDDLELQERAEEAGIDLTEMENSPEFKMGYKAGLDTMQEVAGLRTTSGAILLNEDATKVLLVTSLKTPQFWVFPKGGLEEGLTPQENAKKEMEEEAGIVVFVHDEVYDNIVDYPATDRLPEKSQREIYYRASFGSYAQEWEEFEVRKREWFTIDEAGEKLPHHQKVALGLALADHKSKALETFLASQP